MSRKVFVEAKVILSVIINDDADIFEVLDDLDYEFVDTTGNANIIDSEIKHWEVFDSK